MAKRRGNNEGSIRKRQNGRWQAQIRVRKGRFSKTFDSQKECRQWIREMQEQIEFGLDISDAMVTYSDYLKQWLKDVRGSLRPKTWHQYSGVVRNHIEPFIGRTKIRDLRPFHIQQLYTQLGELGRSKRTIKLVHSVLHRSLSIAQKHGMIGRNPAALVDSPKVETKEMQALNEDQAREFLIAAIGDRYEALYHLAVTTGMRQGELLGLKWGDIDWAFDTISVQRQAQRVPGKGIEFSPPKTKAGRRKIQLGPDAMRQLRAHRKRQDSERITVGWQEQDIVFASLVGTPTEQRRLYRCFKKVIKKSGLPDIRFHDLRHTAATLMLLNGIPLIVVSRRLGHSKPSVTLDYYGHYLPGMQDRAATLMDELVTPLPIMAAEWQQG